MEINLPKAEGAKPKKIAAKAKQIEAISK